MLISVGINSEDALCFALDIFNPKLVAYAQSATVLIVGSEGCF
jgi:hypothetical protein